MSAISVSPPDSGITYLRLDVADFGADAGIRRVFSRAHAFVAEALAAGNGVLIHCANGSNRSPTVAIAVLMHLYSWSLADAWEHVSPPGRHESAYPPSC